ncbi:S-adenosyl-L-methionine-dependent methyltransferase [Mycena floridula]|nr:S-adenosyl-L-methionine-dependent methyltransferase [Mycena floridula]
MFFPPPCVRHGIWRPTLRTYASAAQTRKALIEEAAGLPASVVLPRIADWPLIFPPPPQHNRASLSNPKTAAIVADAFVPTGSRNKVIIEAYPGPGCLTRALMKLPEGRIKKIIVMEQHAMYLKYLKPLAESDPRVTILPLDAFRWSSFETLEEIYAEDLVSHPWDAGVHPQLQYISHLPTSLNGEQLVSQLLRLVPDKQWLYKYGRVPMNLLLSDVVWQRILPTDHKTKCKLSVIAEATVSREETVRYDVTQPFEENFYPNTVNIRVAQRHRLGNPFRAVSLVPLQHQAINPHLIDKWDYCIRRLFVRKSQPISKSLSTLGPGAERLEKKLDGVDLEKKVLDLTVKDWALIIKAFDEWPFAPEDLDIGSSFIQDRGGRGSKDR